MLVAFLAANGPGIDLHGLTVDSAVTVVSTLLLEPHLWHSRELVVITGRGKHSVGGPKLLPAIQELLTEEGSGFAVTRYNAGFRIALRS